MESFVQVSVTKRDLDAENFELVLNAAEGNKRWWKRYHGIVFLSLDAESLGLLETLPSPSAGRASRRLRSEGRIDLAKLSRMRFQEESLGKTNST